MSSLLLRAGGACVSLIFVWLCSRAGDLGGEVLVLFSFAMIIALFLRRGLDVAAMLVVSAENLSEERSKSCFREVFLSNITYKIIVLLISAIIVAIHGIASVVLCCVLSVVFLLFYTASEYYRSQKKMVVATLLQFITPYFVGLDVLLLYQGYLKLGGVAAALLVLWLLFCGLKFLGVKRFGDTGVFAEINNLSKRYFLTQLSNTLGYWLPPIVISYVYSAGVSADYNFAFRLGFLQVFVSAAIGFPILRKVASLLKNDADELIALCRKWSVFSLIFAIAILTLSYFAEHLLNGISSVNLDYSLVRVFLIMSTFVSVFYIYLSVFTVVSDTAQVVKLLLISFLLSLAISVVGYYFAKLEILAVGLSIILVYPYVHAYLFRKKVILKLKKNLEMG